jgi:hypothetical protein
MTIGFLALAACGLLLILILVAMIAVILWNQSTARDRQDDSPEMGSEQG